MMGLCELLAPASQYRGVSDRSWEGVGLLVDFLGFSYMGSDLFLMVLWPSNLWLSISTTVPELLYQVDALKQQRWVRIAVGESHPWGMKEDIKLGHSERSLARPCMA